MVPVGSGIDVPRPIAFLADVVVGAEVGVGVVGTTDVHGFVSGDASDGIVGNGLGDVTVVVVEGGGEVVHSSLIASVAVVIAGVEVGDGGGLQGGITELDDEGAAVVAEVDAVEHYGLVLGVADVGVKVAPPVVPHVAEPEARLGHEDGLAGNHQILFAKAALDCILSIIFSANMGAGGALSAVPGGLYQGSITLLASWMQSILTPEIIREVSATGGILMMSIGIVQAKLARIRLANQIPALPVAVLLAKVFL